MNEQELKNQIQSLQREYKDLRIAISSLSGNLNNNAILRGTLSGAGVSAESILKCIIQLEKINIKTNDPKIPAERADELRKKEVQGLMLDEMIRLTESRLPLRIITHLRTIQAWRNIGSHDKGEHQINETVNSNTLQVVSLALSELVTWFVGEYLNQDATGFIYEENSPTNDATINPLSEWTEEYWFAMRKGILKVLDEAKLKKIQTKYNLSLSEIESIKSNFLRQDELFIQILEEAFEDNLIDIDELEAIEQSRNDCCISIKETREILDQLNWKGKFKNDPNNLDVQWMKEELTIQNANLTNSKNPIELNTTSSTISPDIQQGKINIKAMVEKLKFLVIKTNTIVNADKVSIWKGYVFYIDYTICKEYRIFVDTVLKDEGWEIHLNGRNTKSKNFLLETMCKTPGFLPLDIENYKTDERLVFKELTPVSEIEIIKDSIIEIVQRIQNFENLIK